ncbi:splicing factor 3b subunit [Cyclospora cayetanensis]|uniref:Splicing factor 3b subunit n=1 Tax=Cyclospora cayetanensis TaxID=88456 RepID=A0A1D3CSQ2_9EIME|nr:splicing factor 3b subunit [Cyclospora cayetanensis]
MRGVGSGKKSKKVLALCLEQRRSVASVCLGMPIPRGAFDSHLYGETPVHQYLAEIPAEDEQPTPLGAVFGEDPQQQRGGVGSVSRLVESERRAMLATSGGESEAAALMEKKAIAAREDTYRRQRFQRALSPERQDPFAAEGGRREDVSARSYADVMVEQQLDREKQAAVKQIRKLQEDAAFAQQLLQQRQEEAAAAGVAAAAAAAAGKRGRWDGGDRQLTEAERWALQQQQQQGSEGAAAAAAAAATLASRWDTPLQAGGQAPGWGDTPMASAGEPAAEAGEQKPKKRSRWDATPAQGGTGQVRRRFRQASLLSREPTLRSTALQSSLSLHICTPTYFYREA